MTDNEQQGRPLPTPPKTPFGGNRWNLAGEGLNEDPLLADKLAMAAAEGKIESFINSNIPDSDQARALAMMMLSMSGMADLCKSSEAFSKNHSEIKSEDVLKSADNKTLEVYNSEDICRAVQSGDIHKVKEMLKEEYTKRYAMPQEDDSSRPQDESAVKMQPTRQEQELIDKLSAIASENNTNIDWLIMRALKFYIAEYERTGRL